MDYGGVWSDAAGFFGIWINRSCIATLEKEACTEQEQFRKDWPRDCLGQGHHAVGL